MFIVKTSTGSRLVKYNAVAESIPPDRRTMTLVNLLDEVEGLSQFLGYGSHEISSRQI